MISSQVIVPGLWDRAMSGSVLGHRACLRFSFLSKKKEKLTESLPTLPCQSLGVTAPFPASHHRGTGRAKGLWPPQACLHTAAVLSPGSAPGALLPLLQPCPLICQHPRHSASQWRQGRGGPQEEGLAPGCVAKAERGLVNFPLGRQVPLPSVSTHSQVPSSERI